MISYLNLFGVVQSCDVEVVGLMLEYGAITHPKEPERHDLLSVARYSKRARKMLDLLQAHVVEPSGFAGKKTAGP